MTSDSRKAQEWAHTMWDKLTPEDRWGIGDAFVLDTFEWEGWFTHKPPIGGTREMDKIRKLEGF